MDRHFRHVAEIHPSVVDRAVHGTGVGTAMMSAIEPETDLWGEDTPCLIMVKPFLGFAKPDLRD